MRFDIAHHHLHDMSRRDALKFGAGAAAPGTLIYNGIVREVRHDDEALVPP